MWFAAFRRSYSRRRRWVNSAHDTRRHNVRLRVELLEQRVLLAGDIGDTLLAAEPTGVMPGGAAMYEIAKQIGDGPLGDRDVDLYRFQAQARSRLTAETSLPAGGAEMDTGLRLFDAAGNELAFDDDREVDVYSLLSNILLETDGTYYVGVSGFENYS